MTILQYFEVVGLAGKSTVVVQELEQKVVSGDAGYQGRAVPVPKKYKDSKKFKIRLRGSGQNASGKVDGHYVRKWDGKPGYFNYMD